MEHFKLVGAVNSVAIHSNTMVGFKGSENPFAGRRNVIADPARQHIPARKRQPELMTHIKKS